MTLYILYGFSKALEFGVDVPRDVFHIQVCRNELFASRGVNAKEARRDCRRTADAYVNFFRACLPDHLHDFLRGGSANYRIIDQDYAQSFDKVANGV